MPLIARRLGNPTRAILEISWRQSVKTGGSLITGAAFEQNVHSDRAFCRAYLENRPDDAEKETVVCDGA